MNAAIERALRKATIGSRHDVLTPEQPSKPLDALRNEFGMLHHVGGVTNDSRDQNASRRQLGVFPDLPFVLMPRIGRLDHIGARPHRQDEVDDVPERDVTDMRTGPTSSADVVANAILGDALKSDVSMV